MDKQSFTTNHLLEAYLKKSGYQFKKKTSIPIPPKLKPIE
jgi:hypothetical protein